MRIGLVIPRRKRRRTRKRNSMQTKPETVFLFAAVFALSVALPCLADSWALNPTQVRAAPNGKPGVKTVRGYAEGVVVRDSNGKPLTGDKRKAILKMMEDQGIKSTTVWMDENGYATWEAPAAINEDGSFSEDILIKGRNENVNWSEFRYAALPCSYAGRPMNDAQLHAAPRDNPSVKTTYGFVYKLRIRDSGGKPIAAERRKSILKACADQGNRDITFWMGDGFDERTWQAPAAINEDGTFPEEVVITGLDKNKGRTEIRKKVAQAPPAPPKTPVAKKK